MKTQIKYLNNLPKKIYWKSKYFYLQMYTDCQDNYFIGYRHILYDYLAPEETMCGVIINGNNLNIEDTDDLIGEDVDFESAIEKLYHYISTNTINVRDKYVMKKIKHNSKKMIKTIIKNKQ